MIILGGIRLARILVCVVREDNAKLHRLRFQELIGDDKCEIMAFTPTAVGYVERQRIAGYRGGV